MEGRKKIVDALVGALQTASSSAGSTVLGGKSCGCLHTFILGGKSLGCLHTFNHLLNC